MAITKNCEQEIIPFSLVMGQSIDFSKCAPDALYFPVGVRFHYLAESPSITGDLFAPQFGQWSDGIWQQRLKSFYKKRVGLTLRLPNSSFQIPSLFWWKLSAHGTTVIFQVVLGSSLDCFARECKKEILDFWFSCDADDHLFFELYHIADGQYVETDLESAFYNFRQG